MDERLIHRLMMMKQQQPQMPPEGEPPPIDEAALTRQMQAAPQPQARMQTPLADYIRSMTAQDPRAPQMRAAIPKTFATQIPGLSDLFAMFQGKPVPDSALDKRLGSQVGQMFANNQRHAEKLDDFERERVRNSMLLNQLQRIR